MELPVREKEGIYAMNLKMFADGVCCFFVGLRRFYSDRSLMKYCIIPFLLMSGGMFLLFVFAVGMAFRLAKTVESWISSLPEWISWASRAVSVVAVSGAAVAAFVAAVLILLVFYETFAGPFFDSLIRCYEKKYHGVDLKEVSFKRSFLFFRESCRYNVHTLLLSGVLLIAACLIPVAGHCLVAAVAGYRLGVAYILPTGFQKDKSVREQLELLAGKKSAVFGFGITVYLLFLLPPFVSIFLLPGMILGGTEVIHLVEEN